MGTRNLTVVIKDKEPKIAQYGQWDGYPAGQGATALKFLRSKYRRDRLKKKLKKTIFIDDAKQKVIDKYLKSIGVIDGWMTIKQAELYNKRFPLLTRNIGAEILNLVADNRKNGIWLHNSMKFAGDSLFCEWAYVIDFDRNTFEVYSGFNKEPVANDERFANVPYDKDRETIFFPIKHVKTYSINELPSRKDFVKELEDLTSDE